MKITNTLAAVLLTASTAFAQHEIGLSLGSVSGRDRNSLTGNVGFGTGVAFQANYGYRFYQTNSAALFAEVNFLASPLRDVSFRDGRVTRDIASLYVVPGLRVKFLPHNRLAPFVAIGGGYSLYEHSLVQLDGRPNPAPRLTHGGALGFGGGVDFPIWRFVGGRVDVRDYYTSNPNFNVGVLGSGQHNLVAGGGLVLRLGKGE